MADSLIYLDHAAATPVDGRVIQQMQPYFTENFYNPSATYCAARAAHNAIEAARGVVAHWLGSRSSEIIFTAGGSESNNLAIHGVMRQFPQGNAVVSSVEHESVLAPAQNYDCREVGVQADGRLDMNDLLSKIDDNTVLVSIMYANNEIGTIQPIHEASQMIQGIRRERQKAGNTLPLLLHSDACQAANYLDLHVARLGVDLLTLNAGKIYGPKQSGALYVKGGVELTPLVDGGGQERGLRSGTQSAASAVGLASSLAIAQEMRHEEVHRLRQLQQLFFARLQANMPNVTINGSLKQRLPNNVHITITGQDNERLLIQLDEAGILAAAGSACSASDEEPSHVLRALGLSDADAQSSLRLTMGRTTTEAQVEQTVKILNELAPTR